LFLLIPSAAPLCVRFGLVSHGPPGTQVLDDGFWPFWIYGYPVFLKPYLSF
jgi:hypothetical protein